MTIVSRDVICGQRLFLCFISHYHCFVALIFPEVKLIIVTCRQEQELFCPYGI